MIIFLGQRIKWPGKGTCWDISSSIQMEMMLWLRVNKSSLLFCFDLFGFNFPCLCTSWILIWKAELWWPTGKVSAFIFIDPSIILVHGRNFNAIQNHNLLIILPLKSLGSLRHFLSCEMNKLKYDSKLSCGNTLVSFMRDTSWQYHHHLCRQCHQGPMLSIFTDFFIT